MAEILDSGERRKFDTGAVRDSSEGKGRCDLLPLDVLAADLQSLTLTELDGFCKTRKRHYLHNVLDFFCREAYGGCKETMWLELSKHYEEGARKYAEDNWKKGIPYHCYIDSAVRHYLKWHGGEDDEPHDRAFVWNVVCLLWTAKHLPEMDDLNPRITYTLDEVIAELEEDCTKTEREDKEKAAVSENVHRKTYLEDFLEKYPDAPMEREGEPSVCLCDIYGHIPEWCRAECRECWAQLMPEEK